MLISLLFITGSMVWRLVPSVYLLVYKEYNFQLKEGNVHANI